MLCLCRTLDKEKGQSDRPKGDAPISSITAVGGISGTNAAASVNSKTIATQQPSHPVTQASPVHESVPPKLVTSPSTAPRSIPDIMWLMSSLRTGAIKTDTIEAFSELNMLIRNGGSSYWACYCGEVSNLCFAIFSNPVLYQFPMQ